MNVKYYSQLSHQQISAERKDKKESRHLKIKASGHRNLT